MISATIEWSLPEHFSTAVYNIYQNTNSEWFDSEIASSIADSGKRLSYSMISYWVGLQIIAKLYEKESVVAS